MEPAGETTMTDYKAFIDDRFVESASGAVIESVNPATERIIARFPACDAADVERAVRSARKAFDEGPWRAMKAPERARFMRRIAEGIEKRGEELAVLETQDSGKPISDNRNGDVPDAVACFHHFAGWASTLTGSTLETPVGNFHDYTVREPWGVVAAIASWNFPLVNAAWKIAPPLAAGNCVIFKPASDTSLSALLLAEIIREAGVPPGVIHIITGTGAVAGRALAGHRGIDKLSFTGSTAVGRSVGHAAAEGIKSATLELGGKSPQIVFDDCSLAAAVEGVLWGIFFNAGQVCTAGSRLLLQEGIYEPFMTRLVEAARAIRIGDPMDPTTRIGPLVSARQFETVSNFIRGAVNDGARLRTGGARPEELATGFYIAPTIFENVRPDMAINREEVFGPVLVVHRFRDDEEAVALANDTPYGLAAGVWTNNLARAHVLARRIEAGTVWINTYNMAFHNAPNPGFKQSGLGSELGREGLEAYTKIKNVCVNLDHPNRTP